MITKEFKAVQRTMRECKVPMVKMYYTTAANEEFTVREPPIKATTSSVIADMLRPFFHDGMELQESFKVVLLNRGMQVIGVYDASRGTGISTTADPRLVFAAALLGNAKSIIVAHNHPSGQLRPSGEDITITKKLMDAGGLLGIDVHDHLIITADSYFSFADNGMLP